MNIAESIRQIPAFEVIETHDLEPLLAGGKLTTCQAGDYCFQIGQAATFVAFLLEGSVQITQPIAGEEQVMVTYNAPNLFGEVPILIGETNYFANARATTTCCIFLLPAEAFWQLLTARPEVTVKIMRGSAQRIQRLQTINAQRDRMTSVSTLAAGLAHELNNPASAARRAADQLSETMRDVQTESARLAKTVSDEEYKALLEWQERELWQGELPRLDAITRSDREEEMGEWLEERNVPDAWNYAEPLVAAGLTTEDLEQVSSKVRTEVLPQVVAWLSAVATAATQVCTISRSSTRVSQLIETLKGYAYLDQTPLQDVDVNEALEQTLSILNYEFEHVEVIRNYDKDLPCITGYGNELSEVWTSLIENALDAMNVSDKDNHKRLQLTTKGEPDRVFIEVTDNGPGIALEQQKRIFDPFFTTKAVGEGSGLGLSLVYRTVVERHQGDIQVSSKPGETRFSVRLPLHPATEMIRGVGL
jgi:signal transduction histidine kinase